MCPLSNRQGDLQLLATQLQFLHQRNENQIPAALFRNRGFICVEVLHDWKSIGVWARYSALLGALFLVIMVLHKCIRPALIKQTLTEFSLSAVYFVDGSSLQDLIARGREKINESVTDIKKHLSQNSINNEEIINILKEGDRRLANEVDELTRKIDDQIRKNEDVNKALRHARVKVQETKHKLKYRHPVPTDTVETLLEEYKSVWNSINESLEWSYRELTRKGEVKPEQLELFFESIVNKGTQTTKELQEKIEKMINKKS